MATERNKINTPDAGSNRDIQALSGKSNRLQLQRTFKGQQMRDWTPEARARQAELIRSWKPWTRSTGARTAAGKAISSQNRQKSLDRAQEAIEAARTELRRKLAAYSRMKGN